MKIKKLAGVFLSAAVILANFSFCFAEENKGSSIELAVTGTAYSDENIVGGNIYYDPETGTITGCDDSVTSAVIPSEINGVKVTGIGEYAFNKCDRLTSITIPEGVTSIGDRAFSFCIGLTSITIPEGVTSIGNSVFYECCELTSITIPEGVTSIENSTFFSCGGLTSITIPEGVTSIGDSAFFACGLTSITIPDSVTSIGKEAFRECNSLTSVTISEKVTSIGEGAFVNCADLENINVNENNRFYSSVDGVLFNKNKTKIFTYPMGLKSRSYEIPLGVITIGREAFSEGAFENVIIPDTVKTIESGAFAGSYLTSLIIPDSVTFIESGAFISTDLTDVKIGGGVEDLQPNVFGGCLYLKNVEIGEGVKYINRKGTANTFGGCYSLTSLKIPKSVEEIGEDFSDCQDLTIYCYKNSFAEEFTIDENIPYEILEETINVSGITINREPTKLTKGTSIQLTANISPENADNKNVVWESSDTSVATVDEMGLVKGVGKGSTVITVKSEDGMFSAECEVIVNETEYYPTGVLGDVNGDGVVTAADAALVLRKALNGEFRFPIE